MARASTFTSYINSELPSNVDANWNRFEAMATRTYGNIERRAQAASRATAGLIGGRGAAGVGGAGAGAARGLQQQAQAARAVADINGRVSTSSRNAAVGIAAQGRAAEHTARQTSGMARSLTALSTSLNVVQGPLGPLSGRVSALGRAVGELSGFRLGLAGIAGGLFVLGSMGNSYAQLSGRLRGVYADQRDVNRAMDDIVGIARRARTSLEPVADLYIRLAQTSEQYGISARQAAQVAETASKAAILSGGSRASQEAGLYQFSQGFGSNRLGGEELRSILENTNQLAVAIANGMGKSIGELRALGAEGKLTAQVIAQALDKSALDIEQRYARMPMTLSQSTAQFTNSLLVMVGRVDEAIGFTSTLAKVIEATAGSLHFLASAAVGVGVAFAAIKLGAVAVEIMKAVAAARIMNAAVTELSRRRAAAAAESLAQHQREVAALEAEQIQIRETIALLERKRAVAARDLARAAPVTAAGAPVVGASARRASAAANEERAAVRALAGERQRLAVTGGALAAANTRVADTTARVAATTAATAARTGFLRNAVSGLVGAFNPYVLIIGAATTALIYLATAKSNAEKAAEALTEAQRQLSLMIDETTGKIHAQIGALELLARQKTQSEAFNQTIEQYRDSKGRLVRRLQGFAGTEQQDPYAAAARGNVENPFGPYQARQTPAQRQLAAALERFGRNERGYGLAGLQRDIQRLAPHIPQLQRHLTDLGESFGHVRSQAEAVLRQGAAVRVATGTAREGDLALALGTITPYQAQGRKTKAQLDREAAAKAALAADDPRKAALGRKNTALLDLESKRASMDDAEYLRQRVQILQTYDAEIKGIADARRAQGAANRQARHDAAVAKADATQLAAARRDAALLELEQKRPTMGQQDYLTAQVAILRTYDQEVERLNEMSTASSSAAAALISNARKMQREAAAAGEKRRDILSQWTDQPKAITRAADQIDDLNRMVNTLVDGVAAVTEANPLGTGLYTPEMAARDARNIEAGVRKPLRDAVEENAVYLEAATLRLQGLDAEARAFERAIDLQREQGELSLDEFNTLVDIERQQQAINDVLGSRERITSLVLGQVQQQRDAFEELLVDFPEQGLKAGENFLKQMARNVRQIWARKLSEQLFGGADAKVRQLMTGQNGVEQAYQFLQSHTVQTGTALERVATAADAAANNLNNLAGAGGTGTGDIGQTVGNEVAAAINGGAGGAGDGGMWAGLASALAPAIGEAVGDNGDIVITGKGKPGEAPTVPQPSTGSLPGGRQVYNSIYEAFGDNLDRVFGTTFFKKVGGGVGTALEGAGQGMAASSIASMLGIKQSRTGAAIGGAVGATAASAFGLPPELGAAVGGFWGGTIGGMIKKSKTGSSTISMDAYGNLVAGEATGSNAKMKAAASASASNVARGLTEIAEALGATVGNVPGVSIGLKDGKYRVDPTGKGVVKTKKGALDFGEDEEKAIAKAIELMVGRGAIQGISAAAQNILTSGASRDLQAAIEKAVLIESIPRRLLQRTNPVRYAVEELNKEFNKMIAALKEGGATTQQFAEAQQLYDLERADAIEQATAQASSAIDQYLKDMVGSQSSPLNKRTTYDNAQAELAKYAADINSGKLVDQNDLLAAARNAQDSSRALNGSSQRFFTDFQMIYDLLSKARDNAGVGSNVVGLPPSPFESDSTVREILERNAKAQVDATNNQTNILSNQLGELLDLLRPGAGGSGGLGAIGGLASFGGGGGGSGGGGGRSSLGDKLAVWA